MPSAERLISSPERIPAGNRGARPPPRLPLAARLASRRKLRGSLEQNSSRLSGDIYARIAGQATAASGATAESGTVRRSSRSVRQKAEPPLRRKEDSGVVTTS